MKEGIGLYPFKSGKVRSCSKASEYIYSSASNYVDNLERLTIEKADNPVVMF
ncbi:MAG: hypothetical protein ABI576_11875 [Flavobacterium sp.]